MPTGHATERAQRRPDRPSALTVARPGPPLFLSRVNAAFGLPGTPGRMRERPHLRTANMRGTLTTSNPLLRNGLHMCIRINDAPPCQRRTLCPDRRSPRWRPRNRLPRPSISKPMPARRWPCSNGVGWCQCCGRTPHKHPMVKAWLAQNPRVTMHFTPNLRFQAQHSRDVIRHHRKGSAAAHSTPSPTSSTRSPDSSTTGTPTANHSPGQRRLFRINGDVGFWLAPGVMLGCRRIVSGVSGWLCCGSRTRSVRRA